MAFFKSSMVLVFILFHASCSHIRFTPTGKNFDPLPKDAPVEVVIRLKDVDQNYEKIGILENLGVDLGGCIEDAKEKARQFGGDTIILVSQGMKEKFSLVVATWEIARKIARQK